jgi:hypothetical protein
MKQEDIKHSTGKINKKELEADLSIAAAKQYSARVHTIVFYYNNTSTNISLRIN